MASDGNGSGGTCCLPGHALPATNIPKPAQEQHADGSRSFLPGISAISSCIPISSSPAGAGAAAAVMEGPPRVQEQDGPACMPVASTSSMAVHGIAPACAASSMSTHSLLASLQDVIQQQELQQCQHLCTSQPAQVQPCAGTAALQQDLVLTLPQPMASGDQGSVGTDEDEDHELAAQQRVEEHAQGTEHATLFFAKVPRSASRDEVKALFAAHGEVISLNLFAPYENAPASKGCGLVVMRDNTAAAAAMAALDNYTWAGMHSPMVVKLMKPDVQRQRQEERGATGRKQLETCSSGGSCSQPGGGASRSRSKSSTGAWPAGNLQTLSPVAGAPRGSLAAAGSLRMQMGMDVPPAGCAPDAYKLFVGNIPKAYTESDLLPIFEAVGPVKELVVVRNRQTQESKGSAFVWYASGADADKASLQLNMRVTLPQSAGPPNRPLVVRRAETHKQANPMLMRPGLRTAAEQQLQAAALLQDSPAGGVQVGMLPHLGNPSLGAAAVGPLGYGHGSAPITTGMTMGGAQFLDCGAGMVTMAPDFPAVYIQQQQQQRAWQQQVGQQGAVPPGPAVHNALGYAQEQQQQYAAPGVVAMPARFAAGFMQQQQAWQAAQQPQQEQPTLGAGYDLSRPAMATSAGLALTADLQQQQQHQVPLGASILSAPQAVPGAGQLQQLPAAATYGTSGSTATSTSMTPVGGFLLGSCASSGASASASACTPMGSSYQQGMQPHSVSIHLTSQQLHGINSQLGSIAAMSGAQITAEQNIATGSLMLVLSAASQQQLAMAWQLVHGMLLQQGGMSSAQAEVLA